MTRALERHQNGEAAVIPIILRDINWQTAPFAKLGVLPKDGKAITLWSNRDSAWRDVETGIRQVVEERLGPRRF
jgi:internalin A